MISVAALDGQPWYLAGDQDAERRLPDLSPMGRVQRHVGAARAEGPGSAFWSTRARTLIAHVPELEPQGVANVSGRSR